MPPASCATATLPAAVVSTPINVTSRSPAAHGDTSRSITWKPAGTFSAWKVGVAAVALRVTKSVPSPNDA